MKIYCERITNPTIEELNQIESIYESNFPPAERKPFDFFVSRIHTGDYICMVARPENEPEKVVAFAFLMLLPNTQFVFLEYVAVQAEFHSFGIGSQLFRAQASYFQDNGIASAVVWEVEPPDSDDPADPKNRRIRFYKNLGAETIKLSTTYAMPNFELQSGGVPLRLMQLPMIEQPNKEEVSGIIKGIYTVAYPDWAHLCREILDDLTDLEE